jgi:hypothetical protein
MVQVQPNKLADYIGKTLYIKARNVLGNSIWKAVNILDSKKTKENSPISSTATKTNHVSGKWCPCDDCESGRSGM